MTQTLIDVSPPSKESEPSPSVEELEAASVAVTSGTRPGRALTGPDGLLRALTKDGSSTQPVHKKTVDGTQPPLPPTTPT